MSHLRVRKAAMSGGARARTAPAKAAGDAVNAVNSVQSNHLPKARTKNKLPKSMRYDLENALVGLCDVWFENIKPHLVGNNIKLHVHEGCAAAAGGDHERLPRGAPGCSHLDPGAALDPHRRTVASCVGCCPMRPPASRAPSRRPPASAPRLPRTRSPSSPATRAHTTPPQSPQRSNEKKTRRRKRRKGVPALLSPHLSWRVPRLCRTYSVLSPVATPRMPRRVRTATPTHLRTPKPYTYYSRSDKRKDKATQTESLSKIKERPSRRASLQTATFTRLPEHRCPANTVLTRQVRHNCKKSRKPSNDDDRSLFKKNLINIIGENNDKRLRLLFTSPTRDEYPSVMNLATSPCDPKRDDCYKKKVKPWR